MAPVSRRGEGLGRARIFAGTPTDLRVGVGVELVALLLQHLAEGHVVLDDAVVHKRKRFLLVLRTRRTVVGGALAGIQI
jgi:hypothetical protein